MKKVSFYSSSVGKFLVLTLCFLACFSAARAQNAAAPEKSVYEFDVNGLKVIFKRRPGTPTVSAGLFTRGGVRNQTAANAGIESVTLATAVEAGKKFPRETVRREFARTASGISGGAGYDYGVISLGSTRRHFDRTWEIFTDLVLNPAFAPEDFQRIRQQILVGLKNRSISPEGVLDSLEESVVYKGHPYSNDPSGTAETIANLKLEDLKAYHKNLLQTSRLLLVIVGDLEPETVQKQVAASFGKLPRGDYKETSLPIIEFARPTVDVVERSLPTNYVKGVFSAPSLKDPDYAAMRVAITILQSRVNQEVRVRRQLSYAPNAEMDNNAANTANISVAANDANQSVSVMLKEIENMQKGLILLENYGGISGFFLTKYYIEQETNAAQVGELARYELMGGGWRNSLGFLDKINKITSADIQSVAKRYMRNLRFVVVGDPAAVNRGVFLAAGAQN